MSRFSSILKGSLFLQAEDGIRDLLVTGVQTCALPICLRDLLEPDPGPGRPGSRGAGPQIDRKSVVEGKSVDLGGRRIIKKKKRREEPEYLIQNDIYMRTIGLAEVEQRA